MRSEDILLSPKDLAAAIGASESSLRRWVDNGDIRVSRTAGGHRRIPLADAVQFIRKIGAVVVRPEVLNLPPAPDTGAVAGERPAGEEVRLFDALCVGDRELARGLILSWYLQGRPLHELCDGPIRGAMHRVGELWKHDERGILVEHRATDICLGVLAGMRGLLPVAPQSAPLALGGAPAGDPYQMPSLMAATTLAEAGWRDVNFGANTPLELLADEAARSDARLVWLSVSAVDDPKSARAAVKRLAVALAERDIPLVIGGHASAEALPRGSSGVSDISSMGELAAFARGLLARASSSPSAPIVR